MRVVAGAATDIGLVRERNEDSYLLHTPLFAVADGMGGHRGGAVASALALETVEKLFDRGNDDLSELVQEANRAVFERSVLDRGVAGMGTTLTAALVEGDRVRIGHVGDSRAYLLREGELRLLTLDHTLVQQMADAGQISEAEAAIHPHRSILTRALGVEMQVEVDDGLLDARPGDRLVLCTDGLTGMVPADAIRAILETTPDPAEAAGGLVRAANLAGGVDNSTVVVLDFMEDGPGTTDGERPAAHAEGRAGPLRLPVHPQPHSAKPPPPRAFPWRRVAVTIGVLVAAVVVGMTGLRVYLDTQWYVGVSDGHVAVFRGIPATVGGFELHELVVETTIPAEVAASLALYRELDNGITAGDRESADAIVEQIRSDVERLQQNGAP